MGLLKFVLKYYGVYEWLIVRLSAISIAVYGIYLFIFILCSPDLSYVDWCGFFYSKATKMFNLIILLFILIHTWIGMKHILEDYIVSSMLRRLGMGLTGMILYVYLLSGMMIIWGL